MRRSILILLVFVSSFAFIAPFQAVTAAAASDAVVGKWSGTYAGDGAGKFSLTFTADAAKTLTGSIEVVPDMGDGYTTPLRTVTVEGAAVKIAYDSPNGDPIELTLDGSVDGKTFAGTWAAISKDTKDRVATGTFTCTKE